MEEQYTNHRFFSDFPPVIFVLAAIKLFLPIFVHGDFGYFRDEFYYIACSEHLDLGYVDHPPVCAYVLAASRSILGDSLYAIRFPAALAGAGVIILIALIAREMGGRRFAQVFAALCALALPAFLAIHSFYSMNALDHFFWALSIYLIVRLLKGSSAGLWILLGCVLGIGLMNKISILFLGFGFFVGLILTPSRRLFLSKWSWICGLIAFVIFLPYILWEIQHGWPTIEFLENASLNKNLRMSPVAFFASLTIQTGPYLLPMWLLALYYFFSKNGRQFRLLGWISLTVFVLLIVLKGKSYYAIPAYIPLLAGGSLQLEILIEKLGRRWLKPVTVGTVAVCGIAVAPMAVPVLSIEQFIKYSSMLGITHPQEETNDVGELPQLYADMVGWEEMVQAVGLAYAELPQEDREKCAILADNYGQAGAIDFLGDKHGLPDAICPHNSYHLWGPRDYTGELVLSLMERDELERLFDEITQVGVVRRDYSMPYEDDRPIFLCRKPKWSLQEIWPRFKSYV